jgi:hypothetical protein
MVSDGWNVEVNYIGLAAYLTNAQNAQSLQAIFTYDASIGMTQLINVKLALNDPNGVLTGTSLYDSDNHIGEGCTAGTTNADIIDCVYNVAASVPGFNWMWYYFDEPGCPGSTGFCQGSLAGGNYKNVDTLARYLKSIDPNHVATGVNTPGGCTDSSCPQSQENALYSTDGQSSYCWMTCASTPYTGYDFYPICASGYPGCDQGSIDSIGYLAGLIQNTINANHPVEKMTFVVQAFSWYQEGGGYGCSSISVCPYPTTAQIQDMRDQALYYGHAAGNTPFMILYYYWPDIVCEHDYTGCNPTASRASVSVAGHAPFPTSPPA